jgi:hypothetical protein
MELSTKMRGGTACAYLSYLQLSMQDKDSLMQDKDGCCMELSTKMRRGTTCV